MSRSTTRKVRFVCISDTHNASPKSGAFKLPKGDVLIHAGDLTRQGTYRELRKTLEWISEVDYDTKIVVAGNHDMTLDKVFYSKHGARVHNQHPEDAEKSIALFHNFPSVTYLNHEMKEIQLAPNQEGLQAKIRIFGSPYSPSKGTWAFGYAPDEAEALWDQIPENLDILVTHTPPEGYCDRSRSGTRGGCSGLLAALARTKPYLHVCGHIHEAGGVEEIHWKTTSTASIQGLADEHRELDELHPMEGADKSFDTRENSLVINASIMATSWPYQSRDGSLYRSPIVVDLDLPTFDHP